MQTIIKTPVKTEIKPGPGNQTESVKTHPAFGLVRFSRVTGGDSKLFGSELVSGSFIRLTITKACEIWRLSSKSFFGGDTVAEVDMTASQFAELITTMNIGSGVPGTLRFVDGKQVDDFDDQTTVHEMIKEDIKKDTKEISDLAHSLAVELKDTLDQTNLSKAKKEALMEIVFRIRQAIDSNMPFVLDQYQKAAQKINTNAKAELEAFVTARVTALGIQSLVDSNQKKIES